MPECPQCKVSVAADVAVCDACGAAMPGATASFAPVAASGAPATAVSAADSPVLIVRKGPQSGESFFIERPRLTMGRDPEADIFLNDMTVSRAHAVLTLTGSDVAITDAGSLNGVYVNGTSVADAVLREGDVVQVGTFQMVFRAGTASR